MNKEQEIIKMLNDKLEVQDICESVSSTIFGGEIKDVLLLIQNLEKDNTNLKQALNEIRAIINTNEEISKDFWLIKSIPKEVKNDILQIIDKVLGEDK